MDVTDETEYDNEKSYICTDTNRKSDNPVSFYFDKKSDWFQFTQPIIEPGFTLKKVRVGGKFQMVSNPITKRPYKDFKENDILTVWQTISRSGVEHLVCVIVHNKIAYSFGFGYSGEGEKISRFNIERPILSHMIHTIDYHPGALYTPDFLFESRLYDQFIHKRTQVRLIANTYLTKAHVALLKNKFDQLNYFESDSYSKLSVQMIPAHLTKTAGSNKILEDIIDYFISMVQVNYEVRINDASTDDEVKFYTEVVDNLNSSIVDLQSHIVTSDKIQYVIDYLRTLQSNIFDSKMSRESLKKIYDDTNKGINKLVHTLEKIIINPVTKPSYALCYMNHIIPIPSLKYCEWTRSSIIGQQSPNANCASFIHDLFADVISCRGQNIAFNPSYCTQKTDIKSDCNIQP